jgi:glutathione S-transferase
MVNYKLSYFDVRGLAEHIRLMFHYANQPFEDFRIPREEWPNIKPKTPYGRVPVLDIDGQELAESFAIARFLGKKFGLAGKNDLEQALVDAVGDVHKDLWNETLPYFAVCAGFREGDKEKLSKETLLPALEKFLPIYVKKVKESGAFLFGASPTWVDFVVAEYITTLSNFASESLKSYPQMTQFRDRVYALPQLQSYLKSRQCSGI